MNIETYRKQCRDTISNLISPHAHCALVGYPDHWNVGDTAIWVGTRKLLCELHIQVDYTCDAWSYDPQILQSKVPTGPILLIGGGNFGDVYHDEVNLRSRVLQDFPHRRIIQLPQSIWFRDPIQLQKMATLLSGQHDFILLVRDRSSLAIARDHFPAKAMLCPDLALALSLPARRTAAEVPLFALWREDIESPCEARLQLDNGIAQDWIVPGNEVRHFSIGSRLFMQFTGTPVNGGPYRQSWRRAIGWERAPNLWQQLAWERVQRGCRMLQRGQVVITNRLHAHLLCALMEIPHVVCDNVNGKIAAYRESWPLEMPWIAWANSPSEAIEKARALT